MKKSALSNMRIALCSDQYLPLLSGIADSVDMLARALERRGHTVRIYAPQMSGAVEDPIVKRLFSYTPAVADGGLSIVFPTGMMRDLRAFKPDVIHTHQCGVIGLSALYIAWRLGVPIVGTDHTVPSHYLHYMHMDNALGRYLVRRYSAWFYNRCDVITAPSQLLFDELRAYGATRPMLPVSNPIPNEVFRPLEDRQALKEKFGIRGKAVVLFGRLAKEKNVDAALDVFGAVLAADPDATLVVIGDGPYRTAFEARMRERGLSHRVKMLGVLRGEALVEALNACEVYMITSISEVQSMTMLQAMTCALPVVVAHGNGSENVEDGVSGYVVEHTDIAQFAARILHLLQDKDAAREVGRAARKAAEKYAPDGIAASFEAVYERAMHA